MTINRKTENGREIKNAACGRSGIMLSISVVTTAEHQQATNDGEHDGLPHGTVILMRLVAAWAGSRRDGIDAEPVLRGPRGAAD